MSQINEEEFARLCKGIYEDGDTIYKHNPIGAHDETLLWMLLSVLISYLSLSEQETPCFTGMPTAETYRTAISFVLRERMNPPFDEEKYLDELIIVK
jgi:hypothetical protein